MCLDRPQHLARERRTFSPHAARALAAVPSHRGRFPLLARPPAHSSPAPPSSPKRPRSARAPTHRHGRGPAVAARARCGAPPLPAGAAPAPSRRRAAPPPSRVRCAFFGLTFSAVARLHFHGAGAARHTARRPPPQKKKKARALPSSNERECVSVLIFQTVRADLNLPLWIVRTICPIMMVHVPSHLMVQYHQMVWVGGWEMHREKRRMPVRARAAAGARPPAPPPFLPSLPPPPAPRSPRRSW